MPMLLAISDKYIHYSDIVIVTQSTTELYENTTANMDRQKQTDYTVKPREDTIMMQTLYNSYTIVIL